MLTMGDYSSVSEIGIGVNLAVAYISIFVEPSINRAQKQIDQFRWWTEEPERIELVRRRTLSAEDLEDALTEWCQEFELMTDAIRRHSKFPICVSSVSALCLCATLFAPSLPVNALAVFALGGLAFAPVLLGAGYVWWRTSSERESERKMAKRANGLLSPPKTVTVIGK
jgi:hypothetical protein